MTLSPHARLGPYEIIALIGKGGMGEVYRARDERLGRDVAIKLLRPSFAADAEHVERFELEARAVGQLNHPNILAVFDVGTHEGAPYIVSELLHGETLRRRLSGIGVSVRTAIEVAAQVAQGLSAAHEKGIVHRDLKPENLFIASDGRVKILDFGVVKLIEPKPPGQPAPADAAGDGEQSSAIVGTIGYMAPEQVVGWKCDHRTDIFAFGCVLYEMLAGRRAFLGQTPAETEAEVLKTEPPEEPLVAAHVPPALVRVVRRCLEKLPERRFQSTLDLAFAVESAAVPGGNTSRLEPVRRLRPRRAMVRAGIGLAVAVVIFAGGWLISAARSRVRVPVIQQLTWRNGNVLSARFAPDGATVVYGAAWEARPREIFTTQANGRESRPLGIINAEILAVSRRGELALSLGTRYSGDFTPLTATLARAELGGGATRPLLDNVLQADWSPDGGALAVVRLVDGRHRVEYPTGTALFESDESLGFPRVSPDGRLVAFVQYPRGSIGNLGRVLCVDKARRVATLTPEFYRLRGLAWAPATGEIWFTHLENQQGATALKAVTRRGALRLVARFPGWDALQDVAEDGRVLITRERVRGKTVAASPAIGGERDLSWLDGTAVHDISRDGRTLLLAECAFAGGPLCSTYLRGLDGSPAVRLAEGYPSTISPDGRWVILDGPGRKGHRIVPTGAGEARDLPSPGMETSLRAEWRPDGETIVFAVETGSTRQLVIQGINGGAPLPTGIEVPTAGFVLSPDGKRVVLNAASGPPTVVSLLGGPASSVPGLAPGDFVLDWRSEGMFVTAHLAAVPLVVDLVSPATGARQRWRELGPADRTGLATGDFTHVCILSRDTYAYSYLQVLSDLDVVSGLR